MTDVSTLTALFRVPPEHFTIARNRLVAELRRAGEATVAASVAKLPRPTPVVWAINQVAQRDRAAVERLLDAADQLKHAQLGRSPADVPTSTKTYRESVVALVQRSLAQMKDAGRPTTIAVKSRLTETLMAAATDPALREPLRAGHLSREHAAAGFAVFADARPALRVVKTTGGSPPSPPPADRDMMRRRAEAQLRLETARADLARAESRARVLENAAAEAARGAAEARERAAAARRAATRGQADVRRAEAAVEAAARAARER